MGIASALLLWTASARADTPDDEVDPAAVRQAAEAGDVEAQLYLGIAIQAEAPESEAALSEAFHWFLRAAESEHPTGMFMVGLAYATGRGVGRDAHEAVRWYRKASERGHSDASFNLALLLLEGDGVSADATEAARLLRPLAGLEDPEADYLYAILQRDGLGVAQDAGEAVRLFRRAAARDHLRAHVALGRMLLDAQGTPADPGEARWHLLRAAEGGSADAAYLLGTLSESGTGTPVDAVDARRWYQLGSARGQLDARVRLGLLELESGDGNLADGLALLESAAEAGSAEAHYQLGLVQLGDAWAPVAGGQHIRPDPPAARRAFEAGVAQEHPASFGMLGYMAAAGLAGEPDEGSAARLVRTGAERGDPQSQYWLGQKLVSFSTKESLEQGVEWLTLAAEQGHLDAMNDLAVQKLRGKGTAVDRQGAMALYERAAARGHGIAAQNLCELHFEAFQHSAAVIKGLSLKAAAAGPSPGRAACERAIALGALSSAVPFAELLVAPSEGPPDAKRAVAELQRVVLLGYAPAVLPLVMLLSAEPNADLVEARAWIEVGITLPEAPSDPLRRRLYSLDRALTAEQAAAARARAATLHPVINPQPTGPVNSVFP